VLPIRTERFWLGSLGYRGFLSMGHRVFFFLVDMALPSNPGRFWERIMHAIMIDKGWKRWGYAWIPVVGLYRSLCMAC